MAMVGASLRVVRACVGNRRAACLRGADRRRRSSRPSCARSRASRSVCSLTRVACPSAEASARAPPRSCRPRARSDRCGCRSSEVRSAACGIEPPVEHADQRLDDIVDDRGPAGRPDDHVTRGHRDRRRSSAPSSSAGACRARRGSRQAARSLTGTNEKSVSSLLSRKPPAVIRRLPNASSIVVVIETAFPSRVDDRDVRRRRKFERRVAAVGDFLRQRPIRRRPRLRRGPGFASRSDLARARARDSRGRAGPDGGRPRSPDRPVDASRSAYARRPPR